MKWLRRLMWSILGLLLLGAGVFGVLASRGRLASIEPTATLLPADTAQRWHSWGVWAPLGAIAAGVMLVVAGALLLRVQVRRPRMSWASDSGHAEMAPKSSDSHGMTRVATATLAGALERDLRREANIEDATAVLAGPTNHPTLRLRLALRPGATMTGLHTAVRTALDRFVTTTGVRPDLTDVDVRASTGRSRGRARVA